MTDNAYDDPPCAKCDRPIACSESCCAVEGADGFTIHDGCSVVDELALAEVAAEAGRDAEAVEHFANGVLLGHDRCEPGAAVRTILDRPMIALSTLTGRPALAAAWARESERHFDAIRATVTP